MSLAKQLDRKALQIAVWAAEFTRVLGGTRAHNSVAIQHLHTATAAASADRAIEALRLFLDVEFRLAGYAELDANYMTWEKFIAACDSKLFTDYDGYGELATTDHYVSNVTVHPSAARDYLRPDWATHVCWYNR